MKQPMSAVPSAVPSPCISICQMDDDTGWCSGCLRTLDEIACWSVLDDAQKQGVCLELGRRRQSWQSLNKAEPGQNDGLEGRAA